MATRSVLLVLLFVLSPLSALAGVGPRHTVEVRLLPEQSRVEVYDRIDVGDGGLSAFRLNVGLERPEAALDGRAIRVAREGAVWRLPQQAPAGSVLTLAYAFAVPRAPDPDGPFLGPEWGFLPGWAEWLPTFDGERSVVDLTVEIAAPARAVATGELVEERADGGVYRARFRSNQASEPPSIFSGRFVIDERVVDDLRVRTYFTEATRHLADLYLERAAAYVGRFAQQVGAYPYDGFSIVAAPVPVGLGFAGLTYVSERILPLPFMQTRSLAHEVLHSWFGSAIEVEHAGGNWAEGLTTYLADYGILADPAAARAMRFGWLRDYAALPPERDRALVDFVAKTHDAEQIVGYGKAAFVFHMLARRLGERAFAEGLRRFYREHAFGRAAWSDLEASFEAASGQPLDDVFAQWLERPGAPSLKIEQVAAVEVDGGYEVRLALVQQAPFYDLRVPVRIDTEAGSEQVTVALADGRTLALIETDARPRKLAIDSSFNVFRHLAPGEAPPILRDILLAPSTQTIVLSEDQATRAAADALATALLGEPGTAAADLESASAERSLLLIGTPDQVHSAAGALGMAERPPGADREATATVFAASRTGRPPVLVVQADDAAALEALTRPLPHYRRDSWLRFDGPTVIDRGVWPAGESALSVDLD